MGLYSSRPVDCEWCGSITVYGSTLCIQRRTWSRDCGCNKLVVNYRTSLQKPLTRVELLRSATVLDLKQRIQENEGLAWDQQRLFNNGRLIADELNLSQLQYLGVRHGSSFTSFVRVRK